jgi:glycosyltransferase involved in cell wall biosynthesis
MRKINILHIIPNLKSGGAERLTIDICYHLSYREEFNVKLLLINNDIEFLIPKNIDLQVLKEKCSLSILNKNNYNTNEINLIFKEFQPDIIHTHLFEAEILGRYKLLKKCVYISHIHDNIHQFSTKFNFLKKKNITNLFEKKWIYKNYKSIDNKFIVISKDSEKYCFSKLPPKLRKNIYLLPNAIDFDKFYNPSNSKIIEDRKIKIISVGSLVEKKNHIFLLEIAKELIAKQISFEINIYGGGPLHNFLESQIILQKLQNYVYLRGKSRMIENEFKNSDYYLHTASYEPFGLVLLEAMASGIPVISLNGKGNLDIISHLKNGYIFNEENANEFANAIDFLNQNITVKHSIIEQGYLTAKKYNIKNYMTNLTEYYKKALAK